MTEGTFIPFAKPTISEASIEEVVACLRSGWISSGPRCAQLEKEFADYIGDGVSALTVSSATAGLHLALEALGIGPGDKVLTTTYTFTASAEVIVYLGAIPYLVDIDEATLNMDVAQVERALAEDPAIKAIMPVHIAGLSCDMGPLMALAQKYGIPIVEDAAHALPARYGRSRVGTLGDVTVFSCYATKTLTTGEGGLVVTKREGVYKRMKTMRLHGIDRDVFNRYSTDKPSWSYQIVAPGFKYNMSDIAAALGLHQLRELEDNQRAREKIAATYDRAFADLPLTLPAHPGPDDEHSWHLYIVRVQESSGAASRNEVVQRLADRGVGTSVHFIPLHLHPYWADTLALPSEGFPVSEAAFTAAFSLPIYPNLSDADVDKIIRAVRQAVIA